MTVIERTTSIEDLVRDYPGAVSFMISHRLPCLVCGEPVWGTLEDIAHESGLSKGEIDQLVLKINAEIVGDTHR
jgi:hypothetical protein